MMRRINIKELFQNRKTLYFTLCIVLISVLSLTIVYAALSVTLNITGSTEVTASNWNIHLANPEVKSGSVNSNVPTISGNNLSFSANLTIPGDYYEFTVDVVNDGTIDAMIDSVVKTPELTTEQAKYIKYEVSYENGESISTKQTLKKGTSTPIKVRVEYRKDIVASDLPNTSTELSLKLTLVYVQSDGTGVTVKDNGEFKLINVVSGDGTNTSDEVCIGEECFYVISSTDTTVTMLSKYNLPVGNTAFSNTDSTYVGSIVEGYVNNYNSYLITQGVTPIEARLITKDELIGLGCSEDDRSCSAAPSWVYATSYWSGSAYNTSTVWIIYSSSAFNCRSYGYVGVFGVRPVIVIDRNLIDGASSGTTKQFMEFKIDNISYQAEEGMTWGDWIDSEYNTGGFTFNEYGFVSSDGHHLLLQCVDSSSVIDKNASYTVYPGDMVCDSDDW